MHTSLVCHTHTFIFYRSFIFPIIAVFVESPQVFVMLVLQEIPK